MYIYFVAIEKKTAYLLGPKWNIIKYNLKEFVSKEMAVMKYGYSKLTTSSLQAISSIIHLIVIYLESENEKSLIILENLQKQHCFDSIAIFIYLLDIKSINKCRRSHFDLID
jgi:hypothetical protein